MKINLSDFILKEHDSNREVVKPEIKVKCK